MQLPDIPDFYGEHLIQIVSGRGELIASKHPADEFWRVKVVRCNLCGACCRQNPPTPYPLTDQGWCSKLVKMGDQWECTAGPFTPVNCIADPPPFDDCCITHKKVIL